MMMNNPIPREMKVMKHLKPDKRGRICLGSLAKDVEYFCVTTDTHRRVILEPLQDIPEQEKWLYQNKKHCEP